MAQNQLKNLECLKDSVYTRDEVERHAKHDDLWVIYNRKVYNMTPFYPFHPGGDAMLKKAGKDVTVVLHTIPAHATAFATIEKRLGENCIGTIKY
ncbi:unnamed protein product [Dracunculus medinensis]|uniref:Cytochrome b5 heme-binding domain-containing protein n=1 Tax=Dracunculus medinensis TaxID=318479 RepID=A0A0N4UL38_DRAME|nr:unnamed protein product [Dracunculus medinensis]